MAYRHTPFAPDEWYHCYTRTVDYSRPFEIRATAERFLELIYLANQHTLTPYVSDLRESRSHDEMFLIPREAPLVSIGAICLMPTHYHLLLRPIAPSGLSRFMQRI